MKLKDLVEVDEFRSKAQIKDWLETNYAGVRYQINPDLSVDILPSGINMANSELRGFPFKFNKVYGVFYCYGNQLRSFHNFPRWISGDFHTDTNPISSLEGAPEYVGRGVHIEGTRFTSLHNIHKFFKEINSYITIDRKVKSHILGLMFIKGLQGVEQDSDDAAVTIINKHLPGGNPHEVQEELIDAGLSEYAKL